MNLLNPGEPPPPTYGVAEVRALGYRIVTSRPISQDLVLEMHPLIRGLLESGAMIIQIERRHANVAYLTVKEWGDE